MNEIKLAEQTSSRLIYGCMRIAGNNSSQDKAKGKHAIQTALDQVVEGKTVLAIAHRLSTIARMDRIVVMDRGRVVEDGPHDALLDRGGLYARLWSRQSGGFLGEDDAVAAAE